MNSETVRQLRQLCPEGGLLCRGVWTVLPSVGYVLTRIGPLWWYVALSAFLYAGWLALRAVRHGSARVRLDLRPWHVAALFVGCLVLLFNVASRTMGTEGNPMRILYEPLPQVYTNASPGELAVLMQNKNDLEERGCLAPIGTTSHGAEVYRLREWCVQAAFVTRVVPPLLAVALLLLEALLLGSLLLRLLRIEFPRIGEHALLALATGAGALIVMLWTLAQLSLFTAVAGWVLAVVIPAVCYREVRFWAHVARNASVHVDVPWHAGRVLLLWMLVSLLALNFLSVVRPFPIGWDDLGRYINQPRLLVSYGATIPTMGTFQWEYLTALGFLLFGYDSTFGATVAMQINWAAGLLAVLAVYVVARSLLGRGAGVLAALLYYVTPVIGHFSYADMKTENAVFAVGVAGLLAALYGAYPHLAHDDDAEHPYRWRWMLLGGALSGLAFGMKATSVMLTLGTGVALLHAFFGPFGFAGGSALVAALYLKQGTLNVEKLAARVAGAEGAETWPYLLACLVAGVAAVAWGMRTRREHLRPAAAGIGAFAAGFLLLALPWMTVNSWQAGNLLPGLKFSPPNTLSTVMVVSATDSVPPDGQPVRELPDALKVDRSHPACTSTSGAEELDRYWGFEDGWGHYLALPWRAVLDLDTGGYYVTELPGFLLFPLLLLLPALWTRRGRVLRAFAALTALLVVQWVFLGNGVPWYGIAMFLGLAVAMEALVRWSPTRTGRAVAWVLVAASLLTGWSMRLWQLDQQKSLLEYSVGKVDAEVLRKRTITHYDLVKNTIIERAERYPQSPFTYRMGTFIPYFVPRNLEYLPLADNQLDLFNCLNQERNHAVTLRRLQALGFNSMVFDTNTATIEKDPEGTLHKKVDSLAAFLGDASLGLQVVVNDPSAGIAFILLPVQ